MPQIDSYITINDFASDEFTEKKSRFIGYAKPVCTADEAMEFVQSIKKKHNDARHNCFAYSLRDGSVRYSDDGEPQGTAGQPILEVLTRGSITDCAIVVTRYFGGVLLGTGGLTRAYTQGAKIAVEAAGIVEMKRVLRCSLNCDYTFYGTVQSICSRHNAIVGDCDFSENITLNLLIDPKEFSVINDEFREISAGKLNLTQKNDEFIKKTAKK